MNASDISNAEFSALLERAESKFHAWHLKELRPERDRRISELKTQNFTSGGRAVFAMRINRELLEREVRERIDFYGAVAHESGNSEMLSKRRLEEYRDLIMTSVGNATGALKGHIERDARAAGDIPGSALPTDQRYIQLRAEILDVVNAELRVLEAEGELAGRAETKAGAGSATATTVNGRKRHATEPQFPNRALWLKNQLRERSWNKHDLSRYSGPDHKTVQKILDGFSVREDVLQRVADGLSKRKVEVTLLDIPQD